MIPPIICQYVGNSFKNNIANMVAPIGSPNILVDTVTALTYLIAQLKIVWPKTVEKIANEVKIAYSTSG
jgi:hypothetical protein